MSGTSDSIAAGRKAATGVAAAEAGAPGVVGCVSVCLCFYATEESCVRLGEVAYACVG